MITNKIAVVTGSGQGLGRAFAKNLLKEGAKVCISDLNAVTGQATAEAFRSEFGQDRVHFIRCDVTKLEDLKALYDGTEDFFSGKVNIFCNNAGVSPVSTGWKICMDINIMSVMSATEMVMDKMDTRNGGEGGLILNTASIVGILTANSVESLAYMVSKHGVVTLTRTLGCSMVLRDTGIKVQCICLAAADTEIISEKNITADARKLVNKLGIMTPEFVADAFIQLIKSGENGAAMCVTKDTPPFLYPDYSKKMVTFGALSAKLYGAVCGTKVVTARHQLALLLTIFIILQLFIYLVLM